MNNVFVKLITVLQLSSDGYAKLGKVDNDLNLLKEIPRALMTPGGDKDEYGCIPSAGYTWCKAVKSCVRPWETACSICDLEGCLDYTQLVGGDRTVHGCIPSAGYVWCAETASCVRPWETLCSTCDIDGCLCGTMIPPSNVPPDDSSCWRHFDASESSTSKEISQKGCNYKPCQNAVCACDEYCCDTAWDLSCRGSRDGNNYFANDCSAMSLCCEPVNAYPDPINPYHKCEVGSFGCCNTMIPPSFVPPRDSTCWDYYSVPESGIIPLGYKPQKGCDYSPCQNAVCACDDYCCEVIWDISCRGNEGPKEDNALVNSCSAEALCCEHGIPDTPDVSDNSNNICGEPKDDYKETSLTSINEKMDGATVMVSYSIQNSDVAACTTMLCLEDDKCCNSCSASSSFDDIGLMSAVGAKEIACQGTDCDYEDNCIYSDDDIVTVYGTVVVNGFENISIEVDQHCLATPSCKDFEYIDFGLCRMQMGYGVIDGKCQGIGGCGTKEYVFYETMEDCEAAC